jgi:hypothetical protein
MPPHVHIDFVVPRPGFGWSVTDFWGWGAHRAQLCCPDYVSDDDMCEGRVPGGTLNLSSISYPGHGRCGDLPLWGKIPMAETEIKPGTSWLVVRSSDHQATRLVTNTLLKYINSPWKRLIFEKRTVCHQGKKLPAFFMSRSVNYMCPKAHELPKCILFSYTI